MKKVNPILGVIALLTFPSAVHATTLLNSFENSSDFTNASVYNARVAQSSSYATQGSYSARVDFLQGACSKVTFDAPSSAGWNLNGEGGISVDITNPNEERADVEFRVEDTSALGSSNPNYYSGHCLIEPHETETYVLPINPADCAWTNGLVDVPFPGAITTGSWTGISGFNAAATYDFQFIVQNTTTAESLYFDNVHSVDPPVFSGLADQYGQYSGATWPNKITSNSDFAANAAAENTDLNDNPAPSIYDQYGGYLDGPTLIATDWFYATSYKGKQWLVTPSGHLFFCFGMDAVRAGEPTLVSGRTSDFQSVPAVSATNATLFTSVSGITYGPVAAGTTFDFYGNNVLTKFGATNSTTDFLNLAIERLRSWGFNTIGDDSCGSIYKRGTPETIGITLSGAYSTLPAIAPGHDLIPDPWDPAFPAAAAQCIAPVVASEEADHDLIGYYIENEQAWAGEGTNADYELGLSILGLSSGSSYAKQQFVDQLESEYSTIGAFNSAWGTSVGSWSALGQPFTAPSTLTNDAEDDINTFTYNLACKYFSVLTTQLKTADPNHLFLGCRFDSNYFTTQELMACAKYADVVSMNIYQPTLRTDDWSVINSINRPFIISEFQIGSLDGGPFSPGLVVAPNQTARAQMFTSYVQQAASIANIVGVNWFKYTDMPTAGLDLDGENGNNGFVDVGDTPYSPMVAASRSLATSLYPTRYSEICTLLDASASSESASGAVTLTATLTDSSGDLLPGKTISFEIGAEDVGTAVTNGSGVATLATSVPSGLIGDQRVDAFYTGDSSYLASQGNAAIDTLAPTALAMSPYSAQVGVDIVFDATLTRSDIGTPLQNEPVTFSIDGKAIGTELTHSTGIAYYGINTNSSEVGSHTLTASFAGDTGIAPSSVSSTFSVGNIPTAVAVPSVTMAYQPSFTITATLTRTDTGAPMQNDTLTFTRNGVTLGTALTHSTGIAYLTLTPSTSWIGKNSITVTFAGDSEHASSTGSGTVTVASVPTAISIHSVSGQVGAAMAMTATLTRTDTGAGLQGNTITFALGGTTLGTATTNSDGTAYLTLNSTSSWIGTKTLTASFAGNTDYTASTGSATSTVTAIPTQVNVTNASMPANATLTLTATLLRSDTGAPLQGCTLTFTRNGASIGSATTTSTGMAYLNVTPSSSWVGSNTIAASFAGNSTDTGSSGSGTVSVTKIPTAVSVPSVGATAGTSTVFTAVLIRTDTGAPMMGCTLNATVNGVSIGFAATHSTGIAYFSYTPPKGTSGSDKIVVTFAGDANDTASNSSGSMAVAL